MENIETMHNKNLAGLDLNFDELSSGEMGIDRSQSSLRMRYEAEVAVLRKNHGDLEQIRKKMGLSRRKICQFLLVDPSAWTRWTKGAGNVPPHIYKTLGLALQMQEFGGFADPSVKSHLQTLGAEIGILKAKMGQTSKQESQRKWIVASFLIGVTLGAVIIASIFRFWIR